MSATQTVFFDESLPLFARLLAEKLGPEVFENGLIVRDTSGRLRFVSPKDAVNNAERAVIEQDLISALGAYAYSDGVLAFHGEPGVSRLLSDPGAFPVQVDALRFRLLDRRIVGSNWVDEPMEEAVLPARIVFASVKGGVGRSTALAVAAADLSRRNRNVLAIDLDLEAPGLGEMLLDEARMPRYGTVDYLVEDGLGGVTDVMLSEFVGTSALTTGGGGRVDVLPALGREAALNPGNTLAKLSRAMIEDISPDGFSISVSEQIALMVHRFVRRGEYDVVLIDSRAGLSELAAPAILGLGATVLLFGTSQRQTVQGYAALFAGFRMLAERDREAGRRAEWRLLLKAVHAKAPLDGVSSARHRDNLYDLFAENIYDAEESTQAEYEEVTFAIDDVTAPHSPLVIPFAHNFIQFDPVLEPNQLTGAFYELVYRPFLNGIDSIIASSGAASQEVE